MNDTIETACQAWARWHFDGKQRAVLLNGSPSVIEGPEWDNDRPYAECVDMAILKAAKTTIPAKHLSDLLKWVYFDGRELLEFRIMPGPPPPEAYRHLVAFAQSRVVFAHLQVCAAIESVIEQEAARFIKPKIVEVA